MVHLVDHISKYEEVTRDLSREKSYPERAVERVAEEALSLFVVSGEQRGILTRYLYSMASVRPGRKLLKALIVNNQSFKIDFGAQRCEFAPPYHYTQPQEPLPLVRMTPSNTFHFLAMDGGFYEEPSWVVLAHELIHALHYLSSPSQYRKRFNCRKDIIQALQDQEEQWTILGITAPLLMQENGYSTLDMLSENAFHLALGHPPRIGYSYDVPTVVPSPLPVSLEQMKKKYFVWVEKEIRKGLQIPDTLLQESVQATIVFLYDHPSAIHFLPESLKEDEKFLLQLIVRDHDFLKFFSHLRQDPGFMREAIKQENSILFRLPPELIHNRRFIISILAETGFLEQGEELHYYKEWLKEKLGSSLQDDPELDALL